MVGHFGQVGLLCGAVLCVVTVMDFRQWGVVGHLWGKLLQGPEWLVVSEWCLVSATHGIREKRMRAVPSVSSVFDVSVIDGCLV